MVTKGDRLSGSAGAVSLNTPNDAKPQARDSSA